MDTNPNISMNIIRDLYVLDMVYVLDTMIANVKIYGLDLNAMFLIGNVTMYLLQMMVCVLVMVIVCHKMIVIVMNIFMV